MATRVTSIRNDYRCSMERNQSGKYCVRIRARYPRHGWTLGVYFLASSFDRAMKKLEQALDFLQRNEEKLWFWGVDRAADMGISAEFLREAGGSEPLSPARAQRTRVCPGTGPARACGGRRGAAWRSCRRLNGTHLHAPSGRASIRRAKKSHKHIHRQAGAGALTPEPNAARSQQSSPIDRGE